MRVITLDPNNRVKDIKDVGDNCVLGPNDIVSELGMKDQIMQIDGTFIDPPVVPVEPKPTLEEQVAQLQQDNLILMDVLATMYEDMLAKGTV